MFLHFQEDAANKDRELKSKCIEEAHLQQRIETLRKKYKSEQERCRKMSADLASRDCQYKHEKKKKLQEIEKLQAKLHQLLQVYALLFFVLEACVFNVFRSYYMSYGNGLFEMNLSR